MRCSRYRNGVRMHGRLNGEPLEEVDWFGLVAGAVSGSGWRLRKDVVHRMNEGYSTWRALKSTEQ